MSNVVVARNSTVEPLLPNGKLYTFERSLRNTPPWKAMLLELVLALTLLANSGTKMTQQSGLEAPELPDLPRELNFSPNFSSVFLRWPPCLPLSYLFFNSLLLLFFIFSFSLPSGKTNSLDQTTSYQKQMGRWDLLEEGEKIGNYLRSA